MCNYENWQNSYCSLKCYKKSNEYIHARKTVSDILSRMGIADLLKLSNCVIDLDIYDFGMALKDEVFANVEQSN